MIRWHPMYVNVSLKYKGKTYPTRALGISNKEETTEYVSKIVKEEGYSLKEIDPLPLKRLAVQSGLATYGRNNITYIDEFGSNISYLAFITDAISEEDTWGEMNHASICDKCELCMKSCPTGAIKKERFLIDNEVCLAALNEGSREFPDWLPKDVHHTLYDCLRCQERCPMNLKVKDPNEVIQTLEISEEETQMLLDGKGKDDFTKEFLERTSIVGLFAWDIKLDRNIKAIIEAQEV